MLHYPPIHVRSYPLLTSPILRLMFAFFKRQNVSLPTNMHFMLPLNVLKFRHGFFVLHNFIIVYNYAAVWHTKMFSSDRWALVSNNAALQNGNRFIAKSYAPLALSAAFK